MNGEIINIVLPLAGVLLLGVVMFCGARWSRKKSTDFMKSETAKKYRNDLDGKPIIEQLKSKKTWEKVKDGMTYHDPFSDETKALKYDVIRTLGKVPFIIILLAIFGIFAVLIFSRFM